MANLAPRRHSGDDFDHPMLAFYQSSSAAAEAEAARPPSQSSAQRPQRARGRPKNSPAEDPPRRRLSDGALRLASSLVSGLDEEAEDTIDTTGGGQIHQARPSGPPPPPTSLASLAASLRLCDDGHVPRPSTRAQTQV